MANQERIEMAAAPPAVAMLFDLLQRREQEGHTVTPVDLLKAILDIDESVLLRAAADGHGSDEVRSRVEAMLAVQPNDTVPGRTQATRRVIEVAVQYLRKRGDMRLEYFIIGLLEAGGERVNEVLGPLGITAERVLHELPPSSSTGRG